MAPFIPYFEHREAMNTLFNSHRRGHQTLIALVCSVLALLQGTRDALAQAGPTNREALQAEVFVYADPGDAPMAIRAAERMVAETEQRTGKDSRETAIAIGLLAKLQRSAGNFAAAEQLLQRKVAVLEKMSGLHSEDYLAALSNLGAYYRETGHLDKADAPLRKSLDLARQQLARNAALAFFYNQVGLLDIAQGKFAEAESMLKKALEIRKTAPGIDKALLAISHDNLGNLYLTGDRLSDAKLHLQTALNLFRAVSGPTDPDTLICVANVANLYSRTGQTPQAIALLSSSIEALPAEGRLSEKVDLLRQRGNLLVRQQQFLAAQADLGYAIVLASQDTRLSPKLVQVLVDQARVSKLLALPKQGDVLLKRAQTLVTAQPNPDQATLSKIWALRGWFQLQLKDLTQATDFLKLAVADARSRDPGTLPIALINLAIVQVNADELDAAQANILEATKLLVALSPEGVDIAQSYNVLGSILERRGRPALAEVHYRRALAILSHVRPGSDPLVVNQQSNLAILLIHMGRPKEALALAGARAASFEEQLLTLLRNGSEEQARAYIRSQNPFSLFGSIGHATPLARAIFNYQGVVTDAMAELRSHQSSPQQREAFNRWRDARSAMTQWTMTRSALSPATALAGPLTAGPADETSRAAADERLATELAAAQTSFVRINGREALLTRFDVRVEDIGRQIPANAALVNYLRYSMYLGRNKWEDHYGVLVMTRDSAPRWIPLGNAAEIEDIADVYGRAVRGRDPANSLPSVLRVLHERLLLPILGQLPLKVTRLLVVQDGELNLISFATLMDKQDRFVGERYSVSYLASARALLRPDAPSALNPVSALASVLGVPGRKEVRIYANPRFRLTGLNAPSEPSRKGGISSHRLAGLQPTRLAPLPFTRAEAAAVQRVAARNGWRATLVGGSAATERDLRSMPAPGILHFATHGLYLPRFGTDLTPANGQLRGVTGVAPLILAMSRQSTSGRPARKLKSTSKSERQALTLAQAWREGRVTKVEVLSAHDPDFSDPMQRSVITLAGAQDTLNGWRAGRVRPGADDGVLTAEEASMLDLRGTWLVTLSSCDSGVGEPEPGEGIVGLRRGFIEAGAQNVLTTLWPVSDAWTPRLMTDFYSEAMLIGDASQALARVQRRLLIQLRTQHGAEVAARLAGAFVLTTQRAGQL
jgi:CHAT domain-containing protein/tetratricopeptide (TPR) repeat protein